MSRRERGEDRNAGWTYLVQSIDGGPVKIGSTTADPWRRLRALQTSRPDELRIIGLFPGVGAEPALHEQHAEKRIRGEWFDEAVLDEIEVHEPALRALHGESLLRSM